MNMLVLDDIGISIVRVLSPTGISTTFQLTAYEFKVILNDIHDSKLSYNWEEEYSQPLMIGDKPLFSPN